MLKLYFLKELSVAKEQLLGIKRLFHEEVKTKARCSYTEGWRQQAGVRVAQAVCLSGSQQLHCCLCVVVWAQCCQGPFRAPTLLMCLPLWMRVQDGEERESTTFAKGEIFI